MKQRRQPRKTMKLSRAMEELNLSRTGVRDQIFKYKKLQLAPRRGSNTAPQYVYAAGVEALQREWGLI